MVPVGWSYAGTSARPCVDSPTEARLARVPAILQPAEGTMRLQTWLLMIACWAVTLFTRLAVDILLLLAVSPEAPARMHAIAPRVTSVYKMTNVIRQGSYAHVHSWAPASTPASTLAPTPAFNPALTPASTFAPNPASLWKRMIDAV